MKTQTQQHKNVVLNNTIQQKSHPIISQPIEFLALSSLQTLTCQFGNLCQQICSNKYCHQQNPYICLTKHCKCRKQCHFSCSNIIAESLVIKLQKKKVKKNAYIQIIDKTIDQAIDRLSDFRDQTIRKLMEDQEFSGLNYAENRFMKMLENGSKQVQQKSEYIKQKDQIQQIQNQSKTNCNNKINGHFIASIMESIHLPTFQNFIQNQMKTQTASLKTEINKILDSINSQITEHKSKTYIPLPPPLPPIIDLNNQSFKPFLPPPPPLQQILQQMRVRQPVLRPPARRKQLFDDSDDDLNIFA